MKTSILFTFLILFCCGSAVAQECGYIFAKFQILNSKGDFVEDANLQLLHRDADKSILYKDNELSFSKTEHAFKLHHGMCGAHYGTRLVISHPEYEKYESLIDLPLTAFNTEHVFIVKLKRKGSRDAVSLVEQLASRYCMTVRDEVGATIPKPIIKFNPTKQSRSQMKYTFTGNSDGQIDVKVIDGVYDIEVNAETFHKGVLKIQTLPLDTRGCITITLKTKIPPHPIT